ncbi:MAG: BamA/TamA family outer membrane protein [Calditrichaeota bacterium]|nr:BamA/TamA family outer membrane protein [Calditrichota bacterium]
MKTFSFKKEYRLRLFERFLAIFFLQFFGLSLIGYANDNLSADIKVGLALSGGGARGIAHIGVIMALEENNIPIDMIAGTSMGSIVGGLYACGYSGSEMKDIVNKIDWDSIFNQKPDPKRVLVSKRYGIMEPVFRLRFKLWDIYLPFGLSNGQRISEELFYLTAPANFAAKTNFDSLVVPFRAAAVDIAAAELLSLKQGDLAQAIHASMAIPLLFSPARVDNRMLVDGGVLNILPTDIVKDMGADVIIASDLEGLFPLGEEPKHFADVAIHTLDITIRELKKKNVKLADVLIEPDLGNHSSADYSGLDSLILAGYQATMAKMNEIKSLVPKAQRAHPPSKRRLNDRLINHARVAKISVKGNDRVRTAVITGEFPLKEGDIFSRNRALNGVKDIYATGLFENVWLEPQYLADDLIEINIHVIEKYPRTVGFGLNYRSEEGFNGFVQIVHFNFFGWGERFMPLIRFGELHKRAGLEIVNDRFFATPLTVHNGIYYERDRPYLYDEQGEQTGNLETDRIVAQFSVGVQPSHKLLFTAGLQGERVWQGKNQLLGLPSQTSEYWSSYGKIVFDNTDDRYFPESGIRFILKGKSVVKTNRNGAYFKKFTGEFNLNFSPYSFHTISVNLFAGTSEKELPVYERFRSGGPFDLPGYRRDELWGNRALSIRVSYRFKFFKRWYFRTGFSLANVSDADLNFDNFVRGVSTGLAAASPLGPVSLLYGWSDNGRKQLYFSFGYDF